MSFSVQAASSPSIMVDSLSLSSLQNVLAEASVDEQASVEKVALDDGDTAAIDVFLRERFQTYYDKLDDVVQTVATVDHWQKTWLKR